MGILKVEIVLFRFFILQKTTAHQGDLLGLILKIVICNISLSMVELYFLYITHTLPSFICCIMSCSKWLSLLFWTRKVADNRTIPILIVQGRSYSSFLCPSQPALLSFFLNASDPEYLHHKTWGFKGCGRLSLKRTPERAFLILDTWAGWGEVAKRGCKKAIWWTSSGK